MNFNKFLALAATAFVSLVILVAILFASVSGVLNREFNLRETSLAQEKTKEACYNKIWVVVKQKTEIALASTEAQKELVETLMKGRGDSFIKMIHESNPESAFSREQFSDLSNSVEALREEFFREQKRHYDLVKSHRVMHGEVWSGFILGFTSREPLEEVEVISSEATKEVFRTRTENNVSLGLNQKAEK